MMKIGIMGAGGMGCYLGGRLAHDGHDVTFISRGKQLQALRQDGLKVESHYGDFHLPSVKATDDCCEVGPVDLVLFCVKSYDTAAAAGQMKPMVGPETVVLPVQNGIEHIKTLERVLESAHIIGGSCIISAHVPAPGHVRQLGPVHQFIFGELDGTLSQRCQDIQQLINGAGVDGKLVPNIIEAMWSKMVLNSGLFGVYSLARANNGIVLETPEIFELVLQTTAESIAVAQENGIPLTHSILDDVRTGIPRMPVEYEPSMALALRKGQKLELEAVNGAICRFGYAKGVPTPINDVIYACLKPYMNGAVK